MIKDLSEISEDSQSMESQSRENIILDENNKLLSKMKVRD
jgi:hypothetical protein